jgi:hypothetical protein
MDVIGTDKGLNARALFGFPGFTEVVIGRNRDNRPIDLYVAGPYSHNGFLQRPVQYLRFLLFAACVRDLQELGFVVFSPILHSHALTHLGVSGRWEAHARVDLAYMEMSKAVGFWRWPGWDMSDGVRHEVEWCEANEVEQWWFDPQPKWYEDVATAVAGLTGKRLSRPVEELLGYAVKEKEIVATESTEDME